MFIYSSTVTNHYQSNRQTHSLSSFVRLSLKVTSINTEIVFPNYIEMYEREICWK